MEDPATTKSAEPIKSAVINEVAAVTGSNLKLEYDVTLVASVTTKGSSAEVLEVVTIAKARGSYWCSQKAAGYANLYSPVFEANIELLAKGFDVKLFKESGLQEPMAQQRLPELH